MMLGAIWLWWRFTSLALVSALLTFLVALTSGFVTFMVLRLEVPEGPFVAAMYGGCALLAVFTIGSLVVSECWRTGETVAVRWLHLLRALLALGSILIFMSAENARVPGMGGTLIGVVASIFVFFWRGHPFVDHPYVKSNLIFGLWRYEKPPAIAGCDGADLVSGGRP